MRAGYIPSSILRALERTRHRVRSGELTFVQGGESLTGLLGHADYDNITDPRVLEILDDLGPQLEVETYPNFAREGWREIERILDEVLIDNGGTTR